MIHNIQQNSTITTTTTHKKGIVNDSSELSFPGNAIQLPNGDVQITYTNKDIKTAPVMHWSTNDNWTTYKTETMTNDGNGTWSFLISGIEGQKPIYYKISNTQHDWIFLNGQPKLQTGPWISNVFYHFSKQEPELSGSVQESYDGIIKFTYDNPNLKVAPVFHWSTNPNWEAFKIETMTKDSNGDWVFTLSGIKGAQNIYYKISNDQHNWILIKNQPTIKTGPWISNVFRHSPKQDPEFPGSITQLSNDTIKITYDNPNLKVPPVFHWSNDKTWTQFQTKTMTKNSNGNWIFIIPKKFTKKPIYYKISNTPQDWVFLKNQPTIQTANWTSNVFYPCTSNSPETIKPDVNNPNSSSSSTSSNSAGNSSSSTSSNSAGNSSSSTSGNSARNSSSSTSSNSARNSSSSTSSNSAGNSSSSTSSNSAGNSSSSTSSNSAGNSSSSTSSNSAGNSSSSTSSNSARNSSSSTSSNSARNSSSSTSSNSAGNSSSSTSSNSAGNSSSSTSSNSAGNSSSSTSSNSAGNSSSSISSNLAGNLSSSPFNNLNGNLNTPTASTNITSLPKTGLSSHNTTKSIDVFGSLFAVISTLGLVCLKLLSNKK